VVGDVVGDLDFLGDGVSACDASEARSKSRVIDTLALGVGEGFASEPVVPPARLSSGAIAAEIASLSCNVRAGQETSFETILGSLLFVVGRDIAWSKELVDDGLVLADAVAEHAAVVSVMVHTPLNSDSVASGVGDYRGVSPVCCRSVIVDTDACVVATRSAATNRCDIEVRP